MPSPEKTRDPWAEQLRVSKRLPRACQNYEIAVLKGQARVRYGGRLKEQVLAYWMSHEHACELRTRTRALLSRLGVSDALMFSYCSFTGRIDRICRNHQSKTREALARIEIERWAERGLKPEILSALCRTLFAVLL